MSEYIPNDRLNKDRLYQIAPEHYRKCSHQLKTWTDTVCGYQYEARKLSRCLIINETLGAPYTWFLTICDDSCGNTEADIKAHLRQWAKVSQAFRRRGVVATFTREPSESGGVHYHLILSSQHRECDLRSIINAALPVHWRYDLRRIRKNHYFLLYYVTKAKVKGNVDGRLSLDKYEGSRLLFIKSTGFRKCGDIGRFWRKSKTTIWKSVIEKETYIATNMSKDLAKEAKSLRDLVRGWVSLTQIKRNLVLSLPGSKWVRPCSFLYVYV